MMSHCDILAIGWAENNSGFSRVFNSIFKRICDDFRIVHFGINYRGEKLVRSWIVEPNTVRGDIFGEEQLERLILKYRPKVVFICHDYWLYQTHREILKKYGIPTIHYCPVDFMLEDDHRVKTFAGIDKVVFYNQSGLDTFWKELAYNAVDESGFNIEIIPHGVDTGVFYPLPATRAEIREKLFPDRPELRDAFIILNANKNMDRKRIDLTMAAFARFLETNPANAWLYLHMSAIDLGSDLRRQIKALGIDGHVLFTGNFEEKPAVSDATLNLIYNACDVGVNTCQGEGWGLVAFEHAATGKCQIVPDHTACRELWHGIAITVPVDETYVVDVESLAGIFSDLFTDSDLLSEKSNACFQCSRDNALSWDVIADQWRNLFSGYCKPGKQA
ncbi:glycosyltransferase family 4 protein [Flavobacterium pallidum]|uniref:Glycosyl transferase family 1 n=1 Tax=Flavobacterium pallidum TaxID=2172098 RepID=A0A2S1SFT4_9FLAO|nr:glycosyltransferase [Flavobacterium pallidum]AWI25239.1 glycosyl transferase family 1 [Flavobacterium pallidum]